MHRVFHYTRINIQSSRCKSRCNI